MKNLKRTLALVLAVVMAVGLLATGASAKFTDDEQITYKEAVELLSALGVINGYTDGSYKPTANFDRAGLAKMIAYFYWGGQDMSSLYTGASGFADVADTHWAKSVIKYGNVSGYIAGSGTNADGKAVFNPNGTVTFAQLAKVILCALGYDPKSTNISYALEGGNWQLNSVRIATSIGLFEGLGTVDGTKALTREQAAQMFYNALGMFTVATYNSDGSPNTFNDGERPGGWLTTRRDLKTPLTEYFNCTASSYTDAFGRSAIEYTKNNKVIATIANTPDLIYTTAATGKTINADLGRRSNATSITASVTVDGGATTSIGINGTATTAVDTVGGNGAQTYVYYDSTNGTVDIFVINTYVVTVSSVTAASGNDPATVTVANISGNTNGAPNGGTIEATGFAVNDKALITYADSAVQSIKATSYKELTPTAYTTGRSFTADGTVYNYSAKLGSGEVNNFTAKKVYFDSYGYAIYVEGVTATAPLKAIVLKVGEKDDGWGGKVPIANLLFADGTTEIVEYANVAGTTAAAGMLVSYSYASDTKVYTLTEITILPANQKTTQAIDLKQGVPAFTWGGTSYVANALTIFLVQSGTSTNPTYTAYTGIANVPTLSGTTVTGRIETNGVVTIAYITGATISGTTTGDRVYLTGAYSTVNDATRGVYYVANAVVNGTVTTVDLKAAPVKGLYTGISYDSNNLGTVASAATTYSATGTTAISQGVLGLGSGAFAPATDCEVYYISAAGVVTVSSVSAIGTDNNDTVAFTLNSSGLVSAIYITSVPGVVNTVIAAPVTVTAGATPADGGTVSASTLVITGTGFTGGASTSAWAGAQTTPGTFNATGTATLTVTLTASTGYTFTGTALAAASFDAFGVTPTMTNNGSTLVLVYSVTWS